MVEYHFFAVQHCYFKIIDLTKRISDSAVDFVLCDNLFDENSFLGTCHCYPIVIVVTVDTGTDEVEHKLCGILTRVVLGVVARIALKLRHCKLKGIPVKLELGNNLLLFKDFVTA